MNIVFLCSGGGGNLKFLEFAVRRGWIGDARISAVIGDRECGGLFFARENGISTYQHDFSLDRQGDLANFLKRFSPNVIVTNVHRILSSKFVEEFSGRLINLHYSLLPSFSGLIGVRPIREALAYGVKFVGVTAHYVDEGVDTGRPIVQAAIPVFEEDGEDELMDVVFRCGCVSLVTAFREVLRVPMGGIARPVLNVKGRNVIFNPPVNEKDEFSDEVFWMRLKAL